MKRLLPILAILLFMTACGSSEPVSDISTSDTSSAIEFDDFEYVTIGQSSIYVPSGYEVTVHDEYESSGTIYLRYDDFSIQAWYVNNLTGEDIDRFTTIDNVVESDHIWIDDVDNLKQCYTFSLTDGTPMIGIQYNYYYIEDYTSNGDLYSIDVMAKAEKYTYDDLSFYDECLQKIKY